MRHYELGREHYQAGRYPEAAEELEVAHGLDPESPTLAYNLARVYELMGEFERSAEYYALLIAITPEDDEQRQSAEAALERVRGAQAAVDAQAAEQEAAEARAERAAEAAREREAAEREQQVREEATREAEIASRRHGRADAAFFSMAAVSLAGFGAGVPLGVMALRRDNQADEWVVGRGHTSAERQAEQSRARRMAIVADSLLVLGAGAGVTAIVLYFAREKHPRDADPTTHALYVTPSPTRGGFLVEVGGAL